MPERGRQLDKADRRAAGIEGVNNIARLGCGVEPISIETDEAKARGRPAKGIGELPAMIFCQIKIIHRACNIEIGIGIKSAREAQPLMAQIAFNLKIRVKAKGLGLTVLQAAAKFLRQAMFRQLSDVRGHARHCQTRIGGLSIRIIISAPPIGVSHDRLSANLMKGYILRRMAGG